MRYRTADGVSHDHRLDEHGRPAGGVSEGVGFHIFWQDGPLVDPDTGERKAPNGAFVETVLSAVIERIEFYQASEFRCRENALALTKLQEAQHWLDHRTRDRQRRGVEGTHQQ